MRILLIGLGAAGQRHARNLRRLLGPDVQLSAYRVRRLSHVVTPDLGTDDSQDVESALGIETFDDLEAALNAKPDVAVIANPTSGHIDAALACARAGCDLFIEKPLSHSFFGVDELLAEVRERRLIAMVGYQLRFHPSFEQFQRIVESGILGSLLSVRASVGEYLPNWHPYEDYRTSYAARADLGGGVVLTQIHEYDYLYALFGAPRKLFALGGHWSKLEVDVEDTASVLMECIREGRALPVHLEQDYIQRPTSRTCEAVGDRGKALLDFASRTVTVWQNADEPRIERLEAFDRNEPYLRAMRHFLECVAERKRPAIDLLEAKQSLAIALAVKRSIASGAMVQLDGIGDVRVA